MGSEVNVSLSTYSCSVPSISSSTVNSNGLSAGTHSLTANSASAPSAVRSAPLQTNITPSNTSGQSQKHSLHDYSDAAEVAVFYHNCQSVIVFSSLQFSSILSGKAPPNLAQGVPPLLASQYIMGPGGLLPAYPVSVWMIALR